MAYYFVAAFNTSAQALDRLQAEQYFGVSLRDAFLDSAGMSISSRRPLPAPKPIRNFDGEEFGLFLCTHYDYDIPGHRMSAPVLPVGHVAITFKAGQPDETKKLQGATLAAVIASFAENPDDYRPGLFDRIDDEDQLGSALANFTPLLLNDTQAPVEFRMLKTTLVLPGDEGLAQLILGTPYKMPADYKAPPRASDYVRPKP